MTDTLPPLPEERHISLEGSVNFRDLGGYVGHDGRTIKWRQLFRSDSLSRLTHADHAVVRKLGIATVIDLRTDVEVERDRFDTETTPVTYHHVPLMQVTQNAQDFKDAPLLMTDNYITMLSDAAHEIAGAVRVVADPKSGPVIFHCAVGKDRTGVLAALLLGLLGVSDETIVEDYALTARAMVAMRERILQRRPDLEEKLNSLDDSVFSAAPANMERLLSVIEAQWGTIGQYATSIGIGDDTVAALEVKLLEET